MKTDSRSLFITGITTTSPVTYFSAKPKTPGLAAVILTVESDESADFLWRVKEKTGAKLYQK